MSRERDYLDSFLTYIDAERKLSVHTESAYSRDLEDFIIYLEGHDISIDDFSLHDARDYVRNLKKDWAEKTVKRKISAIRTFFAYLQKREYIKNNVFASISLSQGSFHLPSVLSAGEVNELLSYRTQWWRKARDG